MYIVYTTHTLSQPFKALTPTLKLYSNGLSHNNTVIGTLAVDGWAVTFGTARRAWGMSVRPSVHYVPVSDENGLTYRHSFFLPHGSPIILVLPASNIFTKFQRGQPPRGR